jgi:small subunit ribosomal protein S7
MRAAQPSLAARFEAMKIRSMATEPIRRPDDTGVPHVTEETAKINEIMGETKPEIEQGTPVQEVRYRHQEISKWEGLTSSA